MNFKLEKPVLFGGIGLSFLLWWLDHLQNSFAQFGEAGLFTILAASGLVWLFKPKPSKNIILDRKFTPPAKSQVERAITTALEVIKMVAQEAETQQVDALLTNQIAQLETQLANLTTELDRPQINILLTGSKSVGKSTILQLLNDRNQNDQITYQESLWQTDSQGNVSKTVKNHPAYLADLVLFVTSGDLTDPEYQFLSQLINQGQRVILLWNKSDQCLPEQQPQVLQKLRETTASILNREDVINIAAAPTPIKVKRYATDGSFTETMERVAPNFAHFTNRFDAVLEKEKVDLVWANILRQVGLVELQAKAYSQQIKRTQALPIIEKYQWIVAGTAFANPVPALDLLATGAINTQMIIDLGEIYQQKLTLEQAQKIAKEMAELMLKLGLVELSTKALSTVLKSHAVTFVAGGTLQAVSAAYLTRIAGTSLVTYWENQMINPSTSQNWNFDYLGKVINAVFQQSQQANFLQLFWEQVKTRVFSASPNQPVNDAPAV